MEIKLAYDDIDNIKELFTEYTDMLNRLDGDFGVYLSIQGYGDEYNSPGDKYGPPCGRLYIAYDGGQAAGCIALRRISGSDCEMKRLYVKPQFRRNGIAKALVAQIIADAKAIGYTHMLLDTAQSLQHAIALYERCGFYRIGPYNNSPVKNTVFMRYDL